MPLGPEVGLDPGDIVLDGDSASLKRGHSTPSFQPMSIVAKRSPISATAELLLFFCFAFSYTRVQLLGVSTVWLCYGTVGTH